MILGIIFGTLFDIVVFIVAMMYKTRNRNEKSKRIFRINLIIALLILIYGCLFNFNVILWGLVIAALLFVIVLYY